MNRPLRLFLIAGEPSGDLLGARLMAGLKTLTGGDVVFEGIGGESMQEEGMDSLFPQAELAVMGLAEVLPRIPKILKRIGQVVRRIEEGRPDAVVTIDSWGFTGRIAKALKKRRSTIPRIHYVAPMVWAYKEKRVHQLAGRVDLLMCLLANEPPMFEAAGLKAVHVGHPVLESGAGQGDKTAFRLRHGLPAETPILAVLPGSRHSETGRLLPVFKQTLGFLASRHPGLTAVIPTVETVEDEVRAAVGSWPVPTILVKGRKDRYDAFAASIAALAASGTVALELAMADVPMVIGYKMSPPTAFAARRLLKIRHVCLLNLLADEAAVPEFLQENCRPDRLAAALEPLFERGRDRDRQHDCARQALERLGLGGESPGLRAAREVLAALR